MRLDDDAGMVRSPVLGLGTVISDVTLAIPFAGEYIYTVGPHHHKRDKEHVTRDVPTRIRAILIRKGSQGPKMIERNGTFLCTYMNRRVKELQRTFDDLFAVKVVIIGLTRIIEYTLDTDGIEVGRTMPVTQPFYVRLHKTYRYLVAVDNLTSHELLERVEGSLVVTHTLDFILVRLNPVLVIVREINESRLDDILARNPPDKFIGRHVVELQVLLLDTFAVDAEDILTLLSLLEVLDLERRGQFIAGHEHRSRDVLHYPLVRDSDDHVPRLVLSHVVLEHLILYCCHITQI